MSRTATAESVDRGRPVIACQGLTRVFKDFWMRDRARAVDGLTFEVYPREVFGLLGPNGSGKSTTIKIILGLLRATRGRVVVFGRPPTDVGVKRRIGYLPEESYLYPFLNARETLDYYGKLFQIDPKTRRRRIDELLDMVGLAGAQFRPVREYSKGMQRRIGIAQALINDPDLLILDEPTTGLDPLGTRQVKDLILELRDRGKTVLLSSHLLADVEDCVDRMVILYGGRARAEGTVEELLVSRNRTTIETDSLDEETLAEIDELIRRRTGGESSLMRVAHPRQRLEELFLHIVESARAERLETSGAQHEGATAAFLRGEEEGEALIERLVSAGDADVPGQAPAPGEGVDVAGRVTPADEEGPDEEPVPEEDDSVIERLIAGGDDGESDASGDASEQSPRAMHGNDGPAPEEGEEEVDESVIESLTRGDGRDARSAGEERREGREPGA